MTPLLISFYTKDWEYPQHARRLRTECNGLQIEHDIRELKSTGSYLKNTCMKPEFILLMLMEHKRPVLWVDVDASVYKNLHELGALARLGFDFAARPITNQKRTRKWHVGTMWFNPTVATLVFLKAWITRCGDMTDESALEQCWQKGEMAALKTHELGTEYFQILRHANTRPPIQTVIAHRISTGASKKTELPLAEEDERKNG